MEKLKLLYKLSPILLVVITAFALNFAYNCYQDEKAESKRADKAELDFKEYKQSNNAIKQLEVNLIRAYNDGKAQEDDFRSRVDSGLVELHVKVATIERDSTAASLVVERTFRLADSVRQDYYKLRNGIRKNELKLVGWEKYYCTEIAPKNNTEFMCSTLTSKQ